MLDTAVKNLPAGKVKYAKRWNDLGISGRLLAGRFDPKFVMLHHTAGTDSLHMLATGAGHVPVPGAHFLVSRDGTVHVLTKFQCYHAGKGQGFGVPENLMNPFAWGIEVESLGKEKDFTPAQTASVGALVSGLLDGMDKGTEAIINHKDWSTTGKVDTRYTRDEIAGWVAKYRKSRITQQGGYASDPKYKCLVLSPNSTTGAVMIKEKLVVPTGRWVDLGEIDIPKVAHYRYLLTLQVGMPKGVTGGEARLARVGWGEDAAAQGGFDYTGHNALQPRSLISRWRTPIKHDIAGGGKVRVQVYLLSDDPAVALSFVYKATRIRVS